jgi:HD superfamily phosphodiesterase
MPKGQPDWFHIERVYKNALRLQKEVCNETIVKLALCFMI